MATIRQRIACKAIVCYKSKILILREASTYADGTNVGKYHLPGGRLEPGEAVADGLAREVREETSLLIDQGQPVYIGEWSPVIRGEPNQIVAIFFACRATRSAVTLSNEHDAYHWISPAEYQQYDLLPPEQAAIIAYLHATSKETAG
jgi:8-oxo-dGTP diphosphatase